MKNMKVKIRHQGETTYYCETVSCSQDDGASVLGRGESPELATLDFIRRARLDGFEVEQVDVVPAYVS